MSDYRCTKYCSTFENVLVRRNEFKIKFIESHTKCTHHFNLISKKDGKEKIQFLNLFGDKCVYCGTSLSLISIDAFEIDHFVPKGSFSKSEVVIADSIDNLVPACQVCNRKKSNFLFEDNRIINVENGINRIFYRDSNYYIQISDEYKDNEVIKKFYNDLLLGTQMRRIDYLLLNIEGLAKKNTKYSKELNNIFTLILKKKNRFSSFLKK